MKGEEEKEYQKEEIYKLEIKISKKKKRQFRISNKIWFLLAKVGGGLW